MRFTLDPIETKQRRPFSERKKCLMDASRRIFNVLYERYNPQAVLLMVSGGNDSRAMVGVARELQLPFTHICHINTGTGISETTQYVRDTYRGMAQYLEPTAGNSFEEYVLRKGFLGNGRIAHKYAYHILKAQPLRKKISGEIRRNRRGINVLMLCGARSDESDNRMANFTKCYNPDPASKRNIWVNLIHHWTLEDRNSYLNTCEIPENPVSRKLCRSGECMCGTMQSDQARREASYFYPEWGRWLDDLESRVIKKFPWRWGREMPKQLKEMKYGQRAAFYEDFEQEFMPMCVGCGKRD